MSSTRINFSLRETDLLTELVSKYANILECKKTDQITNNQKLECWVKVAREFNSLSGDQRHRSADCLRNKFKNMKNSARKKYADESSYMGGTGGGKAMNFGTNDTDERMKEIMGVSLTGMEGDTALLDEDFDSNEGIEDIHGIDEEEIILGLENAVDMYTREPKASTSSAGINIITTKKGSYPYKTPPLRQPKSAALQNKRTDTAEKVVNWKSNAVEISTDLSSQQNNNTQTQKTPITSQRQRKYDDKISTWAAGKAELAALQKQLFEQKMTQELKFREEQHKLKMQHDEALHGAQLKEIQERCIQQAEKHKIEMLILKKKLE